MPNSILMYPYPGTIEDCHLVSFKYWSIKWHQLHHTKGYPDGKIHFQHYFERNPYLWGTTGAINWKTIYEHKLPSVVSK